MKESPDYVEISLAILKRFSRSLKFDIYVKRSETNFTKVFPKGDVLDWERVNTYLSKGLKYFYVGADDYALYSLYVERLGEQLSNKEGSFTPDEAADLLKELAHFTIHEMVVNLKVDERLVSSASNVVTGCISVLAKDSKNLLKIMKLMSNHAYMMKHSLAVSMFSVILAQAGGVESETNLNNIGMGAFLHDIGVGQLTFDPDEEEELTPEQRKEMWRHPELGKQMLDGVKSVRSDVIQMVLQHHEQPNGHGYPNGIRGAEIYYPAKIVAIADTFCAMISKRAWRDAFSVSEALVRMKELSGKFDKKLLVIFTKVLLPTEDA